MERAAVAAHRELRSLLPNWQFLTARDRADPDYVLTSNSCGRMHFWRFFRTTDISIAADGTIDSRTDGSKIEACGPLPQ
ncbi:hypothetical protein F3J44_12000 [Pantoea sp. Tr-811]|nr:hypothetical protein [Pantoea sp. Tr-811]